MDKYSHQAREWRKREEELTAKVSALESDKHVLQQREGMSRKLKESLVDKVKINMSDFFICGVFERKSASFNSWNISLLSDIWAFINW